MTGVLDLGLWKRNLAQSILTLDLCEGLCEPMALDLREGEEERLRRALREAWRASAAQWTPADERVARTRAIVAAELGATFDHYFDAWILDWMRRPGGDAQAILWDFLVFRGRARTPPSLVARARALLARDPRPTIAECPSTLWDREVVAALGFPVRPLPGGSMKDSPMAWVANRVDYVTFVSAWDKALARAADEREETDAAFHWGVVEARAMGLDPSTVKLPGHWPRPPARPID